MARVDRPERSQQGEASGGADREVAAQQTMLATSRGSLGPGMLQRKIAGRLQRKVPYKPAHPGDYSRAYGTAQRQLVFKDIGESDVLVFLPDHMPTKESPMEKETPVDVFVFFHGWYADYTSAQVNDSDKKDKFAAHDNAAKAAGLDKFIAGSKRIGIAPVGGQGAAWDTVLKGAGGLSGMVAKVLAKLSTEQRYVARDISLAGHSAGGEALGPAALESQDKVHEVTLQDAGYGYEDSFSQLAEWFLLGKPEKTLRIITGANWGTKNDPGVDDPGYSTRYVLKDQARNKNHTAFTEEGLKAKFAPLLAKHKLPPGELEVVVEVQPQHHRHIAAGKMQLESRLVVKRAGRRQGTLSVFAMSPSTDHMDVRNQTMEAAVSGNFGPKP